MIALHPVSSAFLLAGVAIVVLAGVGLFKLRTPYARIHAAGKASPVAFLIAGIGASIELGWGGAARLVLAGAALVLTLAARRAPAVPCAAPHRAAIRPAGRRDGRHRRRRPRPGGATPLTCRV